MANRLLEQSSDESVFPTTSFGRPGSGNPGTSLALGLSALMKAKRAQREAEAERKTYEQLVAEMGGLAPSVVSGGPTAATSPATPPAGPGAAPGASRSKLGGIMRVLAGVATGGTSEAFQDEPFGIKSGHPLSKLEREIGTQAAGARYGKTKEERENRRFKWLERFRQKDELPLKEALREYLDILEHEDLRDILKKIGRAHV